LYLAALEMASPLLVVFVFQLIVKLIDALGAEALNEIVGDL
jgi:hypothetical protein